MNARNDCRGFLEALIGDGRPLLIFSGLCLVLAGGFALFLSVTRQFLPHDVQFLGMTAEQLCGIPKLPRGLFHVPRSRLVRRRIDCYWIAIYVVGRISLAPGSRLGVVAL